ncbi:MAG: hypothetical protein ABIJ09_02805 [Pseudomonadota bacterium]
MQSGADVRRPAAWGSGIAACVLILQGCGSCDPGRTGRDATSPQPADAAAQDAAIADGSTPDAVAADGAAADVEDLDASNADTVAADATAQDGATSLDAAASDGADAALIDAWVPGDGATLDSATADVLSSADAVSSPDAMSTADVVSPFDAVSPADAGALEASVHDAPSADAGGTASDAASAADSASAPDAAPGDLAGWCGDSGSRVGTTGCGLNDRGHLIQDCVNGFWQDSALCDDPDVCVDGTVADGDLRCGFDGRMTRRCVLGHWQDTDTCSAWPSVELVKNLNVQPAAVGSDPGGVVVGDWLLFGASSKGIGRELWVSDGTEAGTRLVRDICPGAVGSWPYGFAVHRGIAYFLADDCEHGRELWRSDGSTAGTFMLGDFTAGPEAGDLSSAVGFGDRVYFTHTSWMGRELWTSDGTVVGTTAVASIYRFGGWSTAVFKNELCFTSTHVYCTDGTPAGTRVVVQQDIHEARNLAATDSHLFFTYNGFNFNGLWRTDGTSGGLLQLLPDTPTGKNWAGPVSVGGLVFFFASPSVSGFYLYRSDGTVDGTYSLVSATFSGMPWLHSDGSNLLFSANMVATGTELWTSDGTVSGTHVVKNIEAGAGNSNPSRPVQWQGDRYVVATAGSGLGLWRLHPDLSDATQVVAMGTAPTLLGASSATLFLAHLDSVHGKELWISDATSQGTHLLVDINIAEQGCSPTGAAVSGGSLFFAASDGLVGPALWRSDGTATGTVPILPFVSLSGLTDVSGTLFFIGDDGVHGSELWSSDGSTSGTAMVKDVTAGSGGSSLSRLRSINGLLYVAVGATLWRSDGTEPGTYALLPVLGDVVALGDEAFFNGYTAATGYELYATDGTVPGTRLVAETAAGSAARSISALSLIDGQLWFIAGGDLWRSDGSGTGTGRIATLSTLLNSTSILGLGAEVLVLGRVYPGSRIWRSDGSEPGTRLTTTLNFDDLLSAFAIGPRVYFVALDSNAIRTLWRYDEATDGPVPLFTTTMGDRAGFQGRQVFADSDALHGQELWILDEDLDSRHLVYDLAPGSASASPSWPIVLGDRLYFFADDGEIGTELWSLAVP